MNIYETIANNVNADNVVPETVIEEATHNPISPDQVRFIIHAYLQKQIERVLLIDNEE